MKIRDLNSAEIIPVSEGIDARLMYDHENAQIIHITLKPGAVLKKHTTPVDVAFFVIEGEGIIEIGKERKIVGPNTLIESPANIPHGWRNESDKDMRFLVIKAPRPSE